MEKSSFFNSISGDRRYKAEEWAEYFASFIANGVFPNPSTGLQVLASNSMIITVNTGKAWINGYFYFNTSNLTITLDNADGVLNRIDRIVVRWDLQDRVISVQVKKGTYSATPSAAAIQRDADAYELVLADVYVGAGAVSISQANITDQRLNSNLCGLVVGTVGELDTTAFSAQLQGWFELYQEMSAEQYNNLKSYMNSLQIQSDADYIALQEWFSNFQTASNAQFQSWFETLQNTLDENTAANLYNQITLMGERVSLLEQMVFTDMDTYPYMILFDDLDGVITEGVWNEGLRCLEC
nr:MAG TPA: Receptor Binding Protein [Caudoviricetes sp.]